MDNLTFATPSRRIVLPPPAGFDVAELSASEKDIEIQEEGYNHFMALLAEMDMLSPG